MAQTKEQLRRLRQKYGLGEYKNTRSPKKTRRRGRRRAKKITRRRVKMSKNSMLKQVAFGAAAGAAVQMISPVKGIVPAAAAGYIVGKLPGAVGGAGASYFISGSTTMVEGW